MFLFKKFNQVVGPFMFDKGLKIRSALGLIIDHPIDYFLVYPFTKLISVEVRRLYREDPELVELKEESSGGVEKESQRRVAILDAYLRPALAKNWHAWFLHSHLKKWIRYEYLWARHGPVVELSLPCMSQVSQFQPAQYDFRSSLASTFTTPSLLFTRTQSPSSSSPLSPHAPTVSQLQHYFDLTDWTRNKSTPDSISLMKKLAQKVGGVTHELRGGALCLPEVDPDGAVQSLPLDDLIELSGGYVVQCGPLNALCERYHLYQIWTREYVDKLGSYLRSRCQDAASSRQQRTIILDVGAGDGLLIELLKDYFERGKMNDICGTPLSHDSRTTTTRPQRLTMRSRKVRRGGGGSFRTPLPVSLNESIPLLHPPLLIAIDDGSWNILEKAPVKRLTIEQALDRYGTSNDGSEEGIQHQVIVLCSWMPMSIDWSIYFRKFQVAEYILIGECDDGQCGDNWLTFGNPHFHDDAADNELFENEPVISEADATSTSSSSLSSMSDLPSSSSSLPKYREDGYERLDLSFLSSFQFSRFDSKVSKSGQTISFRRIKNKEQTIQ